MKGSGGDYMAEWLDWLEGHVGYIVIRIQGSWGYVE